MNEFLNKDVDYTTRANALINPILPKSGLLLMGNAGIEYRSEKGPGFIQIPWTSIIGVRVQMFLGGRYVRGFFIETTEKQLFEFVVDDAKNALKYMRSHLKREQFVANPSNIKDMFKRFKK